jgi:3-phenylpropionate/cinnamic acid dioxygenase small subunit
VVSAALRAEVVDVLHRHPQAFDNHAWALVPTAYTADATLGGRPFDPEALVEPGRVFFPHHTTSVAIHQVDADTLRVWSKYLVVRGDGTVGSGDYQDTLVRTADGWRIAERAVSRGNRPDSDPDGPSTRTLTAATWRS